MAKKSKNYYYDGYYYTEDAGDFAIGLLGVGLFIGIVRLMAKGIKKLFRWMQDSADKLAAEEAEKRLSGTIEDERQTGKIVISSADQVQGGR